LRLAEPRSISLPLIAIERSCHEDRPSGRWPAICCCWAFLFRTGDRIAHMAAQCCNGLLRRGHRSRRCRPCLVRMAVSARARRFTPGDGEKTPASFEVANMAPVAHRRTGAFPLAQKKTTPARSLRGTRWGRIGGQCALMFSLLCAESYSPEIAELINRAPRMRGLPPSPSRGEALRRP
jgi:hypothetical protein